MRMTQAGRIKSWLDDKTKIIDSFFGTETMYHKRSDTRLDIQTKTDLFPYYSYDEESQIYMNDDSVGFVLRVVPVNHLSESEIDALSTLFNELEEGYSVECLFYANPHKVKAKFDSWKNIRVRQGGIIKELAERRIKFLEKGIKKPLYDISPALFRDYEIWLSVSTDNLGSNYSMLETKKKLEKIRRLFETQIEGLGSYSTRIEPEILIRLCGDILDAGLPYMERGYDKYNPISSEIPRGDASIEVESERIILNKKCTVKTYGIKKYPKEWHQGGNDALFGNFYKYQKQISCPFIFHYGFRVMNQSSQKSKAFYNMTRSVKAAESGFAKFLPGVTEKARDMTFLYHKLEEGNLLVHSTHNLVLFADDESQCDTYEQQLKNLYQENGFEIVLEKDLQLVNFLSIFPMMLGNNYLKDFTLLNKTRRQLSWTAGNLISLKGGYKGNSYDKGMLLSDRRGQIFNWSAFCKDEGNYNICVVGKSGAGKSFLMQEIITSNLGDGGKVFIIDDGYSYEKTTKLLGGEFIEVDENLDISLNPFGIINKESYENDGDYRTDIKSFLENILCQMARGVSSCSEEERADIKKALDVVLDEKLNQGGVDDIIAVLEKSKKERSVNLAHLLYGFSFKGLYGSYFKPGKAPVFNSKLVCFELSKIKQQKHLQKVVMMTVMFVVNGAIYLGDRREYKTIMVDEAWDLLGGEEIAKFLEGLARRIRKYGGNLVTGTQGVNDYYANEGSRACWDNSDWRIFMAQKEESIDLLKKDQRISVTRAQIEVMKSIKTSKFGEFVIMGTDLFTVARLMCDLYSVMLYSTKKEHFQRVKDLVRGGMKITDAVEKARIEFFGENDEQN